MQLPSNTRIAGKKTVGDWNTVRSDLNDLTNSLLWTTVFKDYFLTRLRDRYLNPIKSIKQGRRYSGEGFSIMTIICSLIEFLETTYQGTNYRYPKPFGAYEYSKSRQIFIDFLTKRDPFNTQFDLHENRVAEIVKESQYPLDERWLDNQQVCDLLIISKRLLQSYRDEKKIPFSQINHKIYYKASDIQKFLKKNYKPVIGY